MFILGRCRRLSPAFLCLKTGGYVNPSEAEKRVVTNAMRSAEHMARALEGNIRVIGAMLRAHSWSSRAMIQPCMDLCDGLQDALAALHQAIEDEAIEKGIPVPDDGVIPLSGGGSKGGGGG